MNSGSSSASTATSAGNRPSLSKAADLSERGDLLGELVLETNGLETRRSHTPGGDSFDPRLSQMCVLPADRHILEEIGRGEIQ